MSHGCFVASGHQMVLVFILSLHHWKQLGCWGCILFFFGFFVHVTRTVWDTLVILVILEQLAHVLATSSVPFFSFPVYSSPSPVAEPKITEKQCLTVITPSLFLWRAAQRAARFHPSRSFQPTFTVLWHVHEESDKDTFAYTPYHIMHKNIKLFSCMLFEWINLRISYHIFYRENLTHSVRVRLSEQVEELVI